MHDCIEYQRKKSLLIELCKIHDRLSDVTYSFLSQYGSTVHAHRNHLFPHHPKEQLLSPQINSDEALSDGDSPQIPNTPATTSNYDFYTPSLTDSPSIKQYDNSFFNNN